MFDSNNANRGDSREDPGSQSDDETEHNLEAIESDDVIQHTGSTPGDASECCLSVAVRQKQLTLVLATVENDNDDEIQQPSSSAPHIYKFQAEERILTAYERVSLDILDIVSDYRIPREAHDKLVKVMHGYLERFNVGKWREL